MPHYTLTQHRSLKLRQTGRRFGQGYPGAGRGPPLPRGMTICRRCGQQGHIDKYCPTHNNPEFDAPEQTRISNIPKSIRETVASLEGLDMTNKTAVRNEDGTYDIIKSSKAAQERLQKDGESAQFLQSLDMSQVPEALKCPLSNTLLKEAVQLSCCGKCCNDAAIRQGLLQSALICPLCGQKDVSPDSLQIRKDIRDSVDGYIKSKLGAEKEEEKEKEKEKEKPVAPALPVFPFGMPMGIGAHPMMGGMGMMPGMVFNPMTGKC